MIPFIYEIKSHPDDVFDPFNHFNDWTKDEDGSIDWQYAFFPALDYAGKVLQGKKMVLLLRK